VSSSDSTRPITVAELLARNGTIGAPPVSGRRRRRRGNDRAVSVAELTGEIPVIAAPAIEEAVVEEAVVDVEVPDVEVPDVEVPIVEDVEDVEFEEAVADVEESEFAGVSPSAETVVIYPGYTESVSSDQTGYTDYADYPDYTDHGERTASDAMVESVPPLASDPRRQSGAEQMTFDPVDESVDLAELVDEQTDDVEELRSYLRSSQGALFSGETIADDLARRGLNGPDDLRGPDGPPAVRVRPREDRLTVLRHGLVAVLQSVLAVVLGAGLFIAFDQLWRWNNIVALVLSVLVILGLVVAVRLVRKTEDIGSTLIAVAVGALVTLGPLALLQTN